MALSMGLEKPQNGTGVNAPPDPTKDALYRVGNEPGINLNELWVYYNAYKEIRRSGTYNFTTSGSLTRGSPHLVVEASPSACADDFGFFLKHPTIIGYQMVLSFKTFPTKVNGVDVQRLHLVSDPVLTLWNPLDLPVVVPQSSFITVKYWQIPYSLNIRVNGMNIFNNVPLAASLSGSTSTSAGDQNYMSIQLGTDQAEQIVLKPGEVVKFSQSGGIVMGLPGRHTLKARKGFNYDGGFAIPLKDLSGKFIDLRPTDTVAYEAIPNNLTAGKRGTGNSVTGNNIHSRHFSITHHEVFVGQDRGMLPKSLGYGNIAMDWDFGNQRLRQGEIRGTSVPGTKPSGDRVYATHFPNLFPFVTRAKTRPLSAASLQANKNPFLLLSFEAKTELGSATGTRTMLRFNPKAHHVDFYDLSPGELDRMPYEFRAEPMVSWVNRSLDLSPDGSGFFGGGINGALGTNRVITHSIPREPIVSLAAPQHSFANGFVHPKPVNGYATLNTREPMLPQISHAIGNSLAPAILAPDKTEGSLKGGRPVADHSYLVNRALWDDYFFSGVAPRQSITLGETKTQKDVATGFFTTDRAAFKPLRVARYLPDLDGKQPSALIASFFSGNNPTDDGFRNLASYLRVDGLFNPTSVEAWKAMLGGLKGRPIVVRAANGRESIPPASANVPVVGLQNPDDRIADAEPVAASTSARHPSGLAVGN